MMKQTQNLTFIESTKFSDIINTFNDLSISGAHFTNGTFSFDRKLIVPTALAGFKRVTEKQQHLALVVAVNSDESMRCLGKDNFEPQRERAEKIAIPIAQLFPDNQVIVVYYDETTPNKLYEALKRKNFTRTLHKWGYGTSDTEPKIEGAECFEIVYAFPLPNDIKPVCYYDTKMQEPPQKIAVKDLRGRLISEKGVLFDVPEELKCYQDNSLEKRFSQKI